jgi:polyisoprenoid-binding protein YceI
MNASPLCRGPLVASFFAVVLAGCHGHTGPPSQPTASAAAAASAVPAAPPAAVATPERITYRFTSDGSTVTVVGSDAKGKREGVFGKFAGTIVVANANPESVSVTVDIDMTSLQMGDPALTAELKSRHFFDVAKYPKARFVSTAARAGGEPGATDTVTGNLDLHGVTKTIDIPASVQVDVGWVLVDAEFSIRLNEFGLVNPGSAGDRINDKVVIDLLVRATRT